MIFLNSRLFCCLCNRTVFNILFVSLVIYGFIKVFEWHLAIRATTKLDQYSTEEAVNGYYHTASKYEPPEPIDLVYTWVNGSDAQLLSQMSQYPESNTDGHKIHEMDNNELLYSLRSVEKYAPWVRHIYIVTNGQIPSWLNLLNPRLSVVTHTDIFPSSSIDMTLPTFNLQAIQLTLHRIPNLSKRFIYLNDVTYLGRPLYLDDLRSEKDGILLLPGEAFDYCARTCRWTDIGNDVCEDGCMVAECNFDGGDCEPFPLEKMFANGTMIEVLKGAKPEHKPVQLMFDMENTTDNYLSSLVYTHSVLTEKYGFKARKPAATAGFLVDRDAMQEIEKIFPNEVRATIEHRFEHGYDSLQFGMLYHEVLLNATRQKSVEEIFDDFDNDKDG